ncbi:hypothetical protein [Cerasicoccus maritimus]|uniref:hypothetical protein n=1 Tax=Cerasicoccus maritimus TaxID=490089 RepID=UPI002852710C|nr:hypothetical protein [Cerasicoccus maritimus]
MQKMLVGLVALIAASSTFAAPKLNERGNVLANADTFGYLRIKRKLGTLQLGERVSYDLNLFFSSNPATKPGAFGPGWSLPLLDSTFYEYDQGQFIWDAPDGNRRFFTYDSERQDSRGRKVLVHQGGNLEAYYNARHHECLVTAENDPHWAFEYRDGRLIRFRLGEAAEVCRVHYNGRGHPQQLVLENGNKVIFEIDYLGLTTPDQIWVGDQEIQVEMGNGDMVSPDGKTPYKNFRFKFLRRLGDEQFTYTQSEDHRRALQQPKGGKKGKFVLVPVNRITITSSSGADSWAEWEARSGFVTADNGAVYQVRNDAYDPYRSDDTIAPEEKIQLAPVQVSVKRITDGAKKPEQWSYNWKTGVRIYTNESGDLMRKTFIMAPGSAYKKLRKVEQKNNDGIWERTENYSYAPNGDLLRKNINGVGMYNFEYYPEGMIKNVYLNGNLLSSHAYKGEEWQSVKHYSGGSIKEMIIINGVVMKVVVDGVVVSDYFQKGIDDMPPGEFKNKMEKIINDYGKL